MIRILLLFLLLHSALFLSAQINPDSIHRSSAHDSVPFPEPPPPSLEESQEPTIGPVTKEASFPGGPGALQNYIQKNLKANRKIFKSSQRFFVAFFIYKDGSVHDISVIKGENCPQCIDVLQEVFEKMPDWSPALLNGEPVKRKLVVPIIIN